jgi:rhodanese-related sulfurtransferase
MFSFLKKLFGRTDEDVETALHNGAVILDVRTPLEYNQGHHPGSRNIPLHEIRLKIEMIRQWNKPVITVCRSGNRSGMAKDMLQAEGIEVYNGGSWSNLKNKIFK